MSSERLLVPNNSSDVVGRDASSALSPEDDRDLLLRLLEDEGIESAEKPAFGDSPERLPLSFAQKRLWFLDRLQPGNPFYNVVAAFELRGPLNVTALRRSLGEIVRRHGALRTRFVVQDGEPEQKIEPVMEIPVPVTDLRDQEPAGRRRRAEQMIMGMGREPFVLSEGPLLRVLVLQLDEREYLFGLSVHHIVFDEWSMGVLQRELQSLYEDYLSSEEEGREPSPRELPMQYADYTLWQQEWFRGELFERQRRYWKTQLRGMPQVLDLTTDYARPPLTRYRGLISAAAAPRELWDHLRSLSRREGATLFMTLLAAFQTLLLGYTGQTDFGVGVPVANRNSTRFEGMIGFCLNTLVLRADLSGAPTFLDVLARVRETALAGFQHQEMPLERLVEEIVPERDMSHTPLFQAMFALLSGIAPSMEFSGLSMNMIPIEPGTSKCDLTLMAVDSANPVVAFNYDSDLFEPAGIERMIAHFQNLLESIAADASRSIWDLPMLDDAERRRVIEENRTRTEYPREETLAGLFERQALRRGSETAVVCGLEKISYAELNSRANRLANELRDLGVAAESRVGIGMDRSIDMMVAMLGILKAGGAYVPIDPDYPAERLRFMIEDAKPAAMITRERFLAGLPSMTAPVVSLDRDWPRIAARDPENPPRVSSAENLAYIIYTSGSTGRPKGAAVSQRSVVRLVSNTNYIRFTGNEVVAQTANASFDPATFEMWGALLHGGRLIIITNDVLLDAEKLAAELQRNPVDVMFLATALFHELAKQSPALFAPVKHLLFAGEAALPDVVAGVLRNGAPGRLINAYGPAECTAFSTAQVVNAIADEAATVPIGPPVSNTQIYVLDAKMNLLPQGIAGELYIGGEGVGRGYWQRPDLTAERFLPDPFSDTPGSRLYKSGDRVRYRSNGDLEFIGRADNQVKIRGFRVEPGEIETALQQHAGVRDCAVMAKTGPDDGLRLVAYVVGNVSAEELREYLKERLPEYMVPAVFVDLAELPLNANGKVDRRALPEPEARARGYRAPRNPQEQMLCEIFAHVLEARRIGIDDDFFSLGGHSLLATRLVSRIRNVLGAEIELRLVFESPTVAGMTLALQRAARARAPLVCYRRPEHVPVSFAQRRLWFIDQIEKGSAEYNMPEALHLRGPLDVDALRRTIQTIVDRHESLRTHFAQVEGEPVQVIVPRMQVEVPIEDFGDLPIEQRQQRVRDAMAEEWASPFDLATGPVFRLKLLRLGDQEHVLLRTFHHIVSDGWSHGVFTREFMVLYEALLQGRTNPLPPLEIQYADYALWQREYLTEEGLRKELEYWKTQLDEIPEQLEIGADLPRPAVQTFAAEACGMVFDGESLAELKQLGHDHHATLYMTLLAGFALLLQRYSGQRDIVVGSPIANRQDERLEHLIGFFVNTLVMRANVDPDLPFADLLSAVRETALEAYRHQDLPFERLVEELSPERRLDRTPVFQVIFALQNAPMGRQRLMGLEVEAAGGEELKVRFDLEVHAFERDGRLEVFWIYNRDLFTAGRMEQMSAHYRRLLAAAAATPGLPVADLEMLTENERHQLLFEWNRTDVAFPACCVHESFERQAAQTPENTAVIYGKDSLSYRELDRRANRLARHLRELGVTREVPVGLYVERSLEMVVALLGILKAGGSFMPLAGDVPVARRNAMISGAGLRHLITTDAEHAAFAGIVDHIVALDSEAEEIARHSDENPLTPQSPESVAYISYTSGSTGTPKGVLVTHASIMRLVSAPQWTRLDNTVRMLQFTPLNFDPAMFEIWGALLHGGALVVMTAGKVSALEVGEMIRDSAVNSAWLTSGLFREVVDHAMEYLGGLRRLATGGDIVPVEQVRKMLALHPQCQVINGYGPSENGTFTTCYSVPAGTAGIERIAQGVPVGFPVNNTRVYVLDEELKPVPVGVPGELYTSGAGLARGYVNRPDLTAERFIPNPQAVEPGERMYRTGDLIRWSGDGALEFLGRNDSQVKFRGFRIEPTEIEAVLQRHAAVQEALVVVREDDGDKHLLGYVVARPESMEKNEVIGSHLVHWQQLYETTYSESATVADDFNLAGWNSSYTGEPIPREQMRIWVDETVARIRGLRSKRVLEVGCGTGLLLTRLAVECESYVAIDISAEVLSQLGAYLSTRADLRHVVLRQGLAHELSFLNDNSVDLVVLNSVIQYFPNADYLLQALDEAMRVTRSGGHVFVGDVRSLPLLEAFRASVELEKAGDFTAVAELERRTRQAVYGEEELLVDAEFFTELARRRPKLGSAEPAVKTGGYDNELSRFRYDVILTLGDKRITAEPQCRLSWDEQGSWRARLSEILERQPDLSVGVRGLRDGRIAKAVETAQRILLDDRQSANAGELRAAIAHVGGDLPNDVANLAQQLRVDCRWRGFTASGIYDVIFNPREEPIAASDDRPVAYYHRFTNAPAQAAEIARLGRTLHLYLKQHLPEYMVPGAIMVLPAWPLTANGKIDRKALPVPHRHIESYRAPRTPQEGILCDIFAEVLGLDRVGINDNFFDLGGHSLMATRLVSRVRAMLGVDLTLRTLFECPSVVQLAPRLTQGPSSHAKPPLTAQPRPDPLPASYAQQRLWFIHKLDGGSTEYNVCEALRLTGPLDPAALRRAIAGIVERHESLRTHFAEVDGTPVQIIEPFRDVPLELVDLSAPHEGDSDAESARRARTAEAMRFERETPFDLQNGPMLRMKLLKTGAQEHILLRTFHHIVSDAWSHGIFSHELMALYDAFQQGAENPLPPLPVQYADFVLWQRRWLTDEVLNSQMDYWKKELAGIPEQLALPQDFPRPAAQVFDADVCVASLSGKTLTALRQMSGDNQATLYMTLVAAFAVLLQRYCGENDIVVGSPIANRQDSQLEKLIGLFVNSLVVRIRVSPEDNFRQLLRKVRGTTLESYAHQDTPFERLVEALSPRRSLNVTPIFQVLFALQNAPRGPQQLRNLIVEPVAADGHISRVDFEVHAFEQEGEMGFYWLYKRDLFAAWRMEQMARHYTQLLESLLAAPETPLDRIEILSGQEKRQVLVEWNRTEAGCDHGRTVIDLFEEHVSAAPGAPALSFNGETLTYEELDRRSTQLARHLHGLGAGLEVRVGACIERGPEIVIALLSVLKAGATWVPIDPDFPAERVAYMLRDTATRVVLTSSGLRAHLPPEIIAVELDAEQRKIAAEGFEPLERSVAPETAAYIIYTSGSTGKARGVAISHLNLRNMVEAQRRVFAPRRADRIVQFFSFSFDVSIFSTFMALTSGARLALGTRDQLLPGTALQTLLEKEKITIGVLPPVALDHLESDRLPRLRKIIVGGEPWSEDLLQVWGAGRQFFNSYGPTETTVQATVGECRFGEGRPSIGRPIANTRIYLLDDSGNPVPVGVSGELCIAGDGVGRGYLDAALTAEKFVPDAFSEKSGTRLYRTGDWARWLPDGRIDLQGRKDGQVKIRGYRVEIGEVESVLAQHLSVLQCAVMARQESGSEKRLVAYVVAASGKTLDINILREFIKDKLPEYMTPAQFVPLPELPLNSSGKIDRHKLPEVEFAAADSGRSARTPEEEILCQVFAEILGLERAGIDDNFFDLGGHSLLATRLVSRVRSVMGVDLPLRAIFESPTVAELGAHLRNAAKAVHPLTRQTRPERIPLSWAQQRLWFIDQLRGGSPEYNMPEASRLRGPVSYEAMQRALEALVQRHEVLRTRFAEVQGDPVQIVESSTEIALAIEDLTGLSDEEQRVRIQAAIAEEVNGPFDLSRGPLLRMKLLRLKDDEHVLLRNMHHIVTDGWSQGILNREFMALYEACLADRPNPLESLDPLPIQYADYALWQRRFAEADLEGQLQYWKAHLAGIPEELALPKDRPRPPRQTFAADACVERMSADEVSALTRLSQASQTTTFMTLLSALAALLQRYSGQTDIVIGSPIANRRDEQLEKLMGFFVNSLAMRVQVRPEESFRDLLQQVRTVSLDAYRHQDLPFERLVEELSPERSLNRPPIYQVMFMWQNAPMGTQTFKGLTVEPEPGEGMHTHFDLQLQAMEQNGEIVFYWMYNRDLFDAWRMERMAQHFMRLVRAAIASPETPLHLLPILSEDERRQMLVEWNDTARQYPEGQSAMWLIERQAATTPGATALVCGEEAVSYADLNGRSNQLAHYLRELGVGPEVRVGVCAARGPQMLVAMLATLKAGGAYVPLDPKYPIERLNYMLDNSGAHVLVTQASLLSRFSAFKGTVVRLDEQWNDIAMRPAGSLPEIADPKNLAYVIYTSGSTGKPKGVAVCRGNLDAFLHWSLEIFTPEDVRGVLFSTSICFDISVFEIYVPLACGGSIFIVENALEHPSLPHPEKINLVNSVPSAIRELARMNLIPPSVRIVNSCGEALSGAVVKDVYAGTAVEQVINFYGPSEDTVYSTWISISRDSDGVPSIGRPKANSQSYVLDAWLQPVPVGVAGELYLAGAGQARGYLGRPDLTAERFIPDPFTPSPGGRLYRTGDLARWSPEGTLDFLGRADDQVKIRGFRIELGEIESVLQEFPGVEQVVVAAREDEAGEKRLAAYIVTPDGREGNVSALRDYLRERLPEHMSPSHFIFVERFPLTPNGKIDRKALPRPQARMAGLYVAPGTEMEKLVAEVWQRTLGVERVGLDDNFFDLGGHSLLVARVRFALRGRLKRTIDMVDLFTFPTVRGLARHLQEDKQEAASALDSQERAARQKAALLRRRSQAPEAGKEGVQ